MCNSMCLVWPFYYRDVDLALAPHGHTIYTEQRGEITAQHSRLEQAV